MKVLHIGSAMASDWGGIERYVATLANASGPSVDVSVVAPEGSPLAKRVRVETLPITLHRKFDFRTFVAFRRLFRERRFDVLVTHFSPDFVCAALAATGKRVRARILTRHVVVPFKSHRTNLYARLYEGFIGVSTSAADAMVQSGIGKDRVKAVLGGCEALDVNISVSEERAPNGEFHVGSFSRLSPEKGIDTLIAARHAAQVPWILNVFGDGPERSKLRSLAEGAPIIFHGYQSDVATAMAAMDVVVMPSRWEEALGMAALEAFSIGKPVVASRVGGVPELFAGTSCGTLVEAGDPAALAEAIDGYARDPNLAIRHGAAGRKLYESSYTPALMAKRLNAAYHSFIA